MSCCGEREKVGDERPEQRWDYIVPRNMSKTPITNADRHCQNLSDFKSNSCVAPLSYGILYISLLISVAVYVVDTFTAANLLFFNRWSGQVQPIIPFDIARWIFAGCIILSWVLLVYRWLRAIRVMRRGIVAASYLGQYISEHFFPNRVMLTPKCTRPSGCQSAVSADGKERPRLEKILTLCRVD